MNGGNTSYALLVEVLGHEPNLDNSFVVEGGDSFSAIVFMDRLAERSGETVSLEHLLSDQPLRNVLDLQ